MGILQERFEFNAFKLLNHYAHFRFLTNYLMNEGNDKRLDGFDKSNFKNRLLNYKNYEKFDLYYKATKYCEHMFSQILLQR
jgi:hypothetical protein